MSSSRYSMVKDRAFETSSSFLPSDNTPNPFYNKVNDLWDKLEDLDVVEKIGKIVHLFIVDGVLDEVAYLDYVDTKFGDELDEVIDAFENGEPVEPAMPPAPSPKTLYNRVADKEIVDLGSGDCEKLKLCQAKITAVDKEPKDNAHYNVKKLDCELELRDFMEGKEDSVLTSFNSLTQLKDVTQVMEFDGVHVLPDMSYVKQVMSVRFDEGGGEVWGPFDDKDNGLAGDKLCEGYVSVNSYKPEKASLKVKCKVKLDNTMVPQCEDMFYRPVNAESTPKYDGECMFLVVKGNNNPVLVGRNNIGFRLEGVCPDVVLMLEKLPLVGKPKSFCVLRVMEYKGYYPFHGLSNLKRFCSKVRIKIGGIKLDYPGSPELEKYDTDGQIFRIGQLDYRYKPENTVDLADVHAMIRKLEKKYGYCITCDHVTGELNEYAVENVNGNYRLIFKRTRTDKMAETSFERISRMLQWI